MSVMTQEDIEDFYQLILHQHKALWIHKVSFVYESLQKLGNKWVSTYKSFQKFGSCCKYAHLENN